MYFSIDRKTNPLLKKYPKSDYEIALQFARRAHKEFGAFLNAIVLFGSAARKQKSHDIDILIVVNDLTITLSPEVVETYRVIVEKLVRDTSKKIHVTTLKFTNFWNYTRVGDPIAINLLRDGVALIDTGFFAPLQALLFQGRIRPTHEAMWTYFARAPNTLHNSQWHLLQAVIDLYWAITDAAHAALIKVGSIPPTPEHISHILNERMVKKKMLSKKYADTVKKFYDLQKKIVRKEIKEITGQQYDKLRKEATDFVEHMRKFIDKKAR